MHAVSDVQCLLNVDYEASVRGTNMMHASTLYIDLCNISRETYSIIVWDTGFQMRHEWEVGSYYPTCIRGRLPDHGFYFTIARRSGVYYVSRLCSICSEYTLRITCTVEKSARTIQYSD